VQAAAAGTEALADLLVGGGDRGERRERGWGKELVQGGWTRIRPGALADRRFEFVENAERVLLPEAFLGWDCGRTGDGGLTQSGRGRIANQNALCGVQTAAHGMFGLIVEMDR
jgi:hypothetical protein